MTTERKHLLRQYADGRHLDVRASLYRHQRDRVDLVAEALARLPAPDGRPIVDVGCGRGQYLAASRTAGRPAIGVDLSLGMARRARSDSGCPALAVADAAAGLPFADGVAAAALGMHMLYHLPDPFDGLRELRRIVGPGGMVLATTNALDHLAEYHPWVEAAAGRPLTRPGSSFALEHRPAVEAVLGPVELFEWRSVVELDGASALLDYLVSCADFFQPQLDEPWSTVLDRLGPTVTAPLTLSTHVGLFLAGPF